MTRLMTLPTEVFLMILLLMDATDVVRCRAVSKSWFAAFTQPEFLSLCIKLFFPRSREAQLLNNGGNIPNPLGDQLRAVFDRMACRYFHLTNGKPRSFDLFQAHTSDECDLPIMPSWRSDLKIFIAGIEARNRSLPWTYDDGMLVYQPKSLPDALVLLDLEADQVSIVPLDSTERVIRNVRLKHNILVVEWAEPSEPLSPRRHDYGSRQTFRHMATTFDIVPGLLSRLAIRRWNWEIIPRNYHITERFVSSHSKQHYILYLQASVPAIGDHHEVVESMYVWDIAKNPPPEPVTLAEVRASKIYMPELVTDWGMEELSFYGVSQPGAESIDSLLVDSQQGTFTIHQNIIMGRNQKPGRRFNNMSRLISVPFIGHGPYYFRECKKIIPSGSEDWGSTGLKTSLTHELNYPFYFIPGCLDQKTGVYFGLRYCFDTGSVRLFCFNPNTGKHNAITTDLNRNHVNTPWDIQGDDRFLVGANENNDLVVWYFDKNDSTFKENALLQDSTPPRFNSSSTF